MSSDALDLELDIRLKELWNLMGDDDWFSRDEIARYMRAAYSYGCKDAINEEIPGDWARKLGFDLGSKKKRR